jgi:hypothetical protein
MQTNQTADHKGKWQDIKKAIRMQWSKLGEDELEHTRGDVRKIDGLLRQKYGTAGEDYSKRLTEIVNKLEGAEEKNPASHAPIISSATKMSAGDADSIDPMEFANGKDAAPKKELNKHS